MKPLKSDFSRFVQFTTNIEDRLIDFHIDNAFTYDVQPLAGDLADSILAYEPADPTTRPQLDKFYQDYFLRWWVLLAYKRFLQNHGRNVTQFGYTQLQDPAGTFQQVSADDRAVELRQMINDANVSQTFVFKQDWTFDGVTYAKPGDENNKCGMKGREKSFGISAID